MLKCDWDIFWAWCSFLWGGGGGVATEPVGVGSGFSCACSICSYCSGGGEEAEVQQSNVAMWLFEKPCNRILTGKKLLKNKYWKNGEPDLKYEKSVGGVVDGGGDVFDCTVNTWPLTARLRNPACYAFYNAMFFKKGKWVSCLGPWRSAVAYCAALHLRPRGYKRTAANSAWLSSDTGQCVTPRFPSLCRSADKRGKNGNTM